ncbi:MAG: CpaF family protein [Emcibacter sp.]|nr:CpaF family protein [Emcibacter sp.]
MFLQRNNKKSKNLGNSNSSFPVNESGQGTVSDTTSDFFSPEYIELKVMLHGRLLDMINLSALDKMPKEILKAEVSEIIRDLLIQEKKVLNSDERNQLIKDIQDELLGLGPLEPLLKDNTVTDILVNGYKQVFVERGGLLEKTHVRFKDDRHLTRIINKIVAKVGRRVDESMPMVDARLEDGSRVNAIIPPLAVDGALLSIRKFSIIPIDMAKLIELDTIPEEVVILLQNVVRSRRNIVISGGTGSGKTTLLNAMSASIDEKERIITIEDSAELQLQQEHVGRLETRPENIECKGEVTQRDLVKNALRMRPDRIIIGEVRGGEAFDMLQAMNTGHEGSMTTVHANSCRDALSRIEQMVCMNNMDITQISVRNQIASAINVVIQVQRLADGRRRLMTLSEITGMEGDIITLQDIFRFKRQATDDKGNVIGHLVATGIRPRFVEEFAARGLTYPQDIFDPNRTFKQASDKGS